MSRELLSVSDAEVAADEFLASHCHAIDSLARNVAGVASSKLPCLSLGKPDEIKQKVVALIAKCARSKFVDGRGFSTGSWDTDGVFTVTIEDAVVPGETSIRVSLCLAETRFQP